MQNSFIELHLLQHQVTYYKYVIARGDGQNIPPSARHDICPAVAFLITYIKDPNTGDQSKMCCIIKYLRQNPAFH